MLCMITKFFIRTNCYFTISWFKRPKLAFKLSNEIVFTHLIKYLGEILSITIDTIYNFPLKFLNIDHKIGSPVCLIKNSIWFKRPGV